MILIIFISLTILLLLSMAVLGYWQWRQLKQGKIVLVSQAEIALGDLLQKKIDQWYHGFSFFFKQLGHFSYFYFLLALRRLVIITRFLLVKIERKFSRWIDSVRGRGVIHQKGTVSLFLTQIRQSK